LNKVVIACVAADDLSAIGEMSRRPGIEVIAVALDFGHGPGLRELHDLARAVGAARCHVLDVREEFVRDCVLPAIDADTAGDGVDEVHARAREFVAKKLAAIAALEGEADVVPASLPLRPRAASQTARHAPIDRSARVDIAFDNGVPHAVNGIPMSLVEVLDSLATIGAAHGVGRSDAALRVLQAAHHALGSTGSLGTGSARLEIADGRINAQPERLPT
jgi:argininosuccinate synthase